MMKMTPEQALQTLDSIASQVSMPRQNHEAAVIAVSILRQFIGAQQSVMPVKTDIAAEEVTS